MKNIKEAKNIVIFLVLLLVLIYLLSNRTKNVFEEIYYSECPSIIKGGVTNTSLLGVRECYRGNRTLEQDLGRTIYDMKLNKNVGIEVGIEKKQKIYINPYFKNSYLKNSENYVSMDWAYSIEEKILYVSTSLKECDTHEIVQNTEEVLPQLLAEHGIEASSLNEVSDIMLEEFLRQWFEGNSMSKFSMEDLGDFEIVYE